MLVISVFAAVVAGEEATCNSVTEPSPIPGEVMGALPSNIDDHMSLLQIGAERHAQGVRSSLPEVHGASPDDPAHMTGPAKDACADVVPGYFQGAAAYNEAINRYNNGVFLELGAYLGLSTCYMSHLLQAAPEKQVQFDVIDIWGSVEESFKPWVRPDEYTYMKSHGEDAKATFEYDMKISGSDKRIHNVTQGSSMDPNLVNRYEDESISFLYLDTSHQFDFTVIELEMWYPKIKVGGMLCGDDFDHNPVRHAANNWTRANGKDYRLVYSVHHDNGGAKANFCLDKHAPGSIPKEPVLAKRAAAKPCDPVIPGFPHTLSAAAAYNEAVARFGSGVFVEIGSFLGRSSCYMAHLLKQAPNGMNVQFDTIDTWGAVDDFFWESPEVKEEMRKHGEDAQDSFDYFMKLTGSSQEIRHAIRGSSLDKDVVDRYQDKSISFLYLSTAHDQKDTVDALSLWFPKIKVGGLLCGSSFQGAGPGAMKWAKESGNSMRRVYGATSPNWKGRERSTELFCFDKF